MIKIIRNTLNSFEKKRPIDQESKATLIKQMFIMDFLRFIYFFQFSHAILMYSRCNLYFFINRYS